MDFIVTALTENQGRVRHHFNMSEQCHVESIVTHAVVLFAGAYKDCGDFVITQIECSPVRDTGAYRNTRL